MHSLKHLTSQTVEFARNMYRNPSTDLTVDTSGGMVSRKSSRDQSDVMTLGFRKHSRDQGDSGARKYSRDQYLSPNRGRTSPMIPDLFVIQDYSAPNSAASSTSPAFGFPSGSFLSPDSIDSLYRRSNSTASSIFDLSIESDQLEKALKENNTNAVTKILQVHYGKFPLRFQGPNMSDKYSNESRSRRPSSRASAQDADLLFPRRNLGHFERFEQDRRESVTPECDIPEVFRTAIHVAILSKALEVLKILLMYGLDPNEPSRELLYSERRLSSFHPSGECLIEEKVESSSIESGSASGASPRTSLQVEDTSRITEHFTESAKRDSLASEAIKPSSSPETVSRSLQVSGANIPVIHNEEIILTQDELLKLPPLYLAVSEKNVDATELLLSAGADVHVEDKQGNTPLHIAASDLYFCSNCCKSLLRQGAKTNFQNKQGLTPLAIKRELVELQKSVIQDLYTGNYILYGHGKDSDTLKVANKRKSCSSNSEGSRSFGRTGSLKKKFFKRSEAKEKERALKERRRNESTSTDLGLHVDFRDLSSANSSYRSSVSRHRTHSTAVTEDLDSDVFLHVPIIQQDGSSSDQSSSSNKGIGGNERSSSSGRGIMSRMSLRRGEKSKHRNSCVNDQQDKSSFDETEKSLRALIKMAANPECIPSLVEGLGSYMKLVLALTDQADTPVIEAAITQLFSQIIQTIYDQLNDKRECEEKVEHFYDLSRLMIIAFEILKGKQSLHFTALKSINQIIDLCVIHRNHEISCLTKSPEQLSNTELYKHSTPKRKSSQLTSEENTALNRHFSLGRKERRMSHDGHAHSHSKDSHEKSVQEEREDSKSSTLSNCMQVHRTPLDILSYCDPSQILSILHNNITMHKRIIGTRQKCTPSTRIRECTHHCLQIMSARILTVMCHGPSVQHKLVTDGHAKTLVEALDPNHDPHLLCLLLQCLSSVALNPTYHQSLIDADIADMLMQLLLPSDEWYYTNHSTKYAKYVKYHAARILVYLGQLHRLCGRVDLFDTKVFQEAVQLNPIFQGSSPEDTFIEQMALGRIVIWNNKQHIEASSLEGLITHVIEEAVLEDIDKTASPIISLSSSIQSLCVLKSQSDLTTPPVSPACSIQTLIHLSQNSFREFLLMTLPMIVHPVIILRLLAHKMFGNMIRRKNWVSQESKLKPPKEEDLNGEKMCPPRSYSDGKKGLSESKKTIDIHGLEFDVTNQTGTFMATPPSNNQNGTNLALKAIGESLVTPLELNIASCKLKEHRPLTLTQSDSEKGSKPKLFKWQSKKHLSKSQMNVSESEDDSILAKLDIEHSPNHDVDILAFQRELINLPTFVMDTPMDISPVFSRSSSVPDNLASRLNPVASLCQLSTHSSRKRLSKSGHGSEIALSAMVHSGSIVTITKTDVDHRDSSLFFFPPGESTTDTPEDESIANIIVHFDPPQSPLLSSASQSPQAFEFPPTNIPVTNHLQPAAAAQGATSSGGTLLPKSTSNELSLSAIPFIKDSEGLESRNSLIKSDFRSPIHSPINDMPAAHKSVIKVLETWIRVSRSDLENSVIVVHEMRDFLKKLSALGPEYKLWSQKFTGALHLEDTDATNQKGDGPDDDVHVQFKELQDLILSGDLPCSKEEAATLAGIHLHLDEAWPEVDGANYNGPYPIREKMTDRGKSTKSNERERQDNLRKKKELIRNNKARGITVSRRKGRLVKQLSCVSDKEIDTTVDIDISKYLPPLYTHSKKVKQLIEEKQKKLWHTPFYDSEIQLKRLYIKICKNLPGYGCKLYHVKELLKGNTQKKVSRLLGISSEKVILLDNKSKLLAKSQSISDLDEWRTGSGKCHDGLVLEFRGAKTWTLSMLSPDSLKSVTAVLWDALDMHVRFLNSSTLRRESFEFDFQRKQLTLSPDSEGTSRYTKELEGLQKLLQFPEEVAVLLTDTESRLFSQVPAADYVRQVTLDLARGATINAKVTGVEDLIHRFNEVSTWITQLIITQPTHDNRKAVLSCILRLAHFCFCIGNFNSSMEILVGLKSEKLKPFWLLLPDEDLSTMHNLSRVLFSREQATEYRDAVSAALDIKECKAVPFFGGFLKDLRYNLMSSPSIVVLPSESDHSIEFISDYCGQDRFMTRIGVGGLINMDKLKKANAILTDIQLFQYHSNCLISESKDAGLHSAACCEKPPYDNFTSTTVDSDSELDFDSYQPIKQLSNGQDVMIITPRFAQLDHQCLQIMNHGSTLIHIEDESGRSCMSFLKLESDNATLTWKKPTWSALRSNSLTLPDYVLRGDFDYSSIQAMYTRYCGGEPVIDTLEEGHIDVTLVKDVCYADEDSVDLAPVSKRFGLENLTARSNCICLIYGSTIAENKKLYFCGPKSMINTWYHGLCKLCQAAYRLRRQIDKRIQWLKIQYLQLFYDNEACQGPTPAEAISVFGGRRWTPGGPQLSSSLTDSTSSFKRTSSFVMGSTIFKKKSSGPLQSTKEPSPKSSQASGGPGKKTKRSPSPQTRNKQTVSPAVNTDTISDTQTTLPPPTLATVRSLSQPCTSSFLTRYRNRRRSSCLGGKNLSEDNKNSSITHSSRLTFLDFLDLFRAFMLRSRKDLRGLFEQFAITKPCHARQGRKSVHSTSTEASILTRNGAYDLHHSTDSGYLQRRKICDAIAVSSIFENCAGVDTAQNRYLGLKEFREFLEDYQEEHLDDNDIIALIQRHEPDSSLRDNCFLSFEGFAKYLMDKDNYAYIYEKTKHNDEDMDHPLAHYYIASSHNTYLTSHQLKGDSSVELYSQILLTGCRCVELDCWDGDDGLPIIYHGHTLTTKISFKAVVESINRSAFVTSPYPVILSLENHCSIQQQQKMAQIFQTIFGEKLVSQFLFDSDFTDDPTLPSPNQFKYKILIKNKKILEDGEPHLTAKKVSPFSRNYSMVLSEGSTCTSHDYDFEDDDDDEEDDITDVATVKDSRRSMDSQESRQSPDQDNTLHTSGSCGDLTRSSSCTFNDKLRPKSHPDLDWPFDDDVSETTRQTKKEKQKKASQIAQELSDLVVYLQAVKFRGLNVSPNSSLKQKYTKPVGSKKTPSSTPPSLSDRGDSSSISTNISLRQKRPDSTPSCYIVSSLNENKAKHLCRRNPNLVINHTEKQLLRTYPAGMRIDSSNFNPVIFWAHGIQMVALNYQTEDTAMALNTAMFEQNGQSGYVLKPAVKWDKSHVMYNHFNPWDKEFDGLHTTVLTLHVISGQYVCSNFSASTQVEVEIIGIPVDCAKHKTRVIPRNSLNPIWNDVFTFQVMYCELAFIRFMVIDTITSHIVSQRVIPLKCVRPGYRHVRLRNINNQPLELASIFIYSKHEEELLEPCGRQEYCHDSTSAILKSVFTRVKDLSDKDGKDLHLVSPVGTKLKRRMFFISVFGVTAPDEYVILKVTQDTSVCDAIAQALLKAGKPDEKVADYVLVEDVQNSWEKREQERSSSQRILNMSEKVLQAQNKWKGAGTFVLRKVSTDPSSRAWVTTMLSKEQKRQPDGTATTGDWDRDEHMFLVCVYNVSPDQPYTIFKAPTTSTAQDIITQAMMKAHRSEEIDPRNFLLLEELDLSGETYTSASKKRDSEKLFRRILASDENVYHSQSEWKTNGRFVLVDRDMVQLDQDFPSDKKKKSSVQIKGDLFQPSSSGTSLARKFCSKLAKSSTRERSASTDDPQGDVSPGDYPPSPSALTIPLERTYLEPPATPPASITDAQSSKKWKRILKLGKT